eukprot:m.250793 g.250793  ORF g.250793 m.250793 type:complete len:221 (+) comp19531_c0_seq7:165-827(+)
MSSSANLCSQDDHVILQGPRSESGNHQLWMVKPTSKAVPTSGHRTFIEESMSSTTAGDASGTTQDISYEERSVLQGTLWFHGKCSRHVAESLLSSNAGEGTFLLRESETNVGHLSLSVKVEDGCIQHIAISHHSGLGYVFGQGTYANIQVLLQHLLAKPIIGSSRGVVTTLLQPYNRDIEEMALYTEVRCNAYLRERHCTTAPLDASLCCCELLWTTIHS